MTNVLVCSKCGFTLDEPPWVAGRNDLSCVFCGGQMKRLVPDLPSLGRLAALPAKARLLLALESIEPVTKLLDDIDMSAKDGKPRTRIILDYGEATLRGFGHKDRDAIQGVIKSLVLYSQVAQLFRPQAIAEALLSLAISLSKDGELSAEATEYILRQCLIAGSLAKEHSNGIYVRLRQLETHFHDQAADVIPASRIFVSYRRDDTGLFVGRVVDCLQQQFGPNSVFFDVDSIPGGVDFQVHISEVIGNCSVLIAVIGHRWLPPSKWVIQEIAEALNNGIPVIPLLVDAAQMPDTKELPKSISALTQRNGISIDPARHFKADIERVVSSITALTQNAGKRHKEKREGGRPHD